MTPDPTLLASPSTRTTSERPSCRDALVQALQQRDAAGVVVLSRRWVHRHGVKSLEGLIGELSACDADIRRWWASQVGEGSVPGMASQPLTGQPTARPAPPSRLGGEITLEPEPTMPPLAGLAGPESPSEPAEPGGAGIIESLPPLEPPPDLGGLSDIDVDLDALARDTFLLAAPPANPEPPVIPPLARFQPSLQSPPAAPEPEPEVSAEPSPASVEATPPQRPLARLRSLMRDCMEEVARTFQGSDGAGIPATPAAEGPPPAAPQPHQPPVSMDPPAAVTTATTAADPVIEAPRVIAAGRSGPAPRPAPAPSHPDLASLRSWLPDAPEPHQRRAS